MHPHINFAIKLLRDTAKEVLIMAERLDSWKKEKSLDSIKQAIVDSMSEQILKSYPNHSIENKASDKPAETTWLIDPLCGEINFAKGLPGFNITIIVKNNSEITHIISYQPLADDLFIASKGSGAKINDKRIRVQEKTSIPAIGIYLNKPKHHKQLSLFMKTTEISSNLIMSNNPVLDMISVATGKLDGFCGIGISDIQYSVGHFFIKESGGFCKRNDEENTVISGSRAIFSAFEKQMEEAEV